MNAEGTVIAVCVGPGGIPKGTVEEIRVDEHGLEGDRHRYKDHGGPNRAVCLFSEADYESLRVDGVGAHEPGCFGENLLIGGVDFADWRPGWRVRIGAEVELEIHDIREPCKTLHSVDQRFPALMEGRSGFVCSVRSGGWLRPGLTVSAGPESA